MNRIAISSIKCWALERGPVDDLEQLAAELRGVLVDGEQLQQPQTPTTPETGGDEPLPAPNLGSDGPMEGLHDAVCLLLQRFLSPAREGDPALLAELLRLALRLQVTGAKESVAGLLLGGSYRGASGPDGPLETQMVRVLHACGLGDEERRALRQLTGDPDDKPAPTSLDGPPSSAGLDDASGAEVLSGDQVPQVNDPDQVFAFVDAVKEGVTDRRDFATRARVSIRQADFIARAAAALGLIRIEAGGVYVVTERGTRIPFTEDPAGRNLRHQLVGEHPLVAALDLDGAEGLPTLERIESLLAARTALGPGTIRRRAQALRRWVEWWASGGR